MRVGIGYLLARFATTVAVVWAMTCGTVAQIVYDNLTTSEGGKYYGVTNEFGDEIHLAGTARFAIQFLFQYYGNFTPSGDETARIRFYANDGPGKYPKPQTLLYDSRPFPITETNFHSIVLILPGVKVPDMFTWTVQFSGVTQKPGDEIGLQFFDPPAIGAPLNMGLIGSYRDFWKNVNGTWSLFNFLAEPDGASANFGSRLLAIPEPTTVQLTILAGGFAAALVFSRRRKRP